MSRIWTATNRTEKCKHVRIPWVRVSTTVVLFTIINRFLFLLSPTLCFRSVFRQRTAALVLQTFAAGHRIMRLRYFSRVQRIFGRLVSTKTVSFSQLMMTGGGHRREGFCRGRNTTKSEISAQFESCREILRIKTKIGI